MLGKSCLSKVAASFVLAVGFAAAPAGAAIVTNGGFESGDFTGWTLTGDTSFSSVVSDPGVPQSGTFGASFGPFGDVGGISQTIATVAGSTYAVDFWLQNEIDPFGVGVPNSFAFLWGGISEKTLLNAPASGYQHFVYSLTATAATTSLQFNFRNDPAFWDLDNVSVVAAAPIPEPETWALIVVGLGVVAARRRRSDARR